MKYFYVLQAKGEVGWLARKLVTFMFTTHIYCSYLLLEVGWLARKLVALLNYMYIERERQRERGSERIGNTLELYVHRERERERERERKTGRAVERKNW